MWLKYTEVTVGPPVNWDWQQGHNPNDRGRIYHTGKYVDGKWINGIDIDFNIRGGTDDNADSCEIKIYNPYSPRNFFAEGVPIKVVSGYIDYYDSIFLGTVEIVEINKEGVNEVVTLKCADNSAFWLNGKFSHYWRYPKGTRIMKIVTDIAEDYNFPIGHISDNELVTPSVVELVGGYSIKEHLDMLASQVVVPLESYKQYVTSGAYSTANIFTEFFTYYFKQGRFYFIPKTSGFPTGWILTPKTGLKNIRSTSKEKGEWEYTINLMLIPGISEGAVINVKSNTGAALKIFQAYAGPNVFFKVEEFSYMSDNSQHGIEIKAKLVQSAGSWVRDQFWYVSEVSFNPYYYTEPKQDVDQWLEDIQAEKAGSDFDFSTEE